MSKFSQQFSIVNRKEIRPYFIIIINYKLQLKKEEVIITSFARKNLKKKEIYVVYILLIMESIVEVRSKTANCSREIS